MGKSSHWFLERDLNQTSHNMRIVIIGAGNVATHLAKAFAKNNEIVQIFSNTISNAQLLATSTNCPSAINDISHIVKNADLYVISIKDDAIAQIIEKIPFNTGLWVHTSGSVSIDILTKKFTNCGVLYPLQTFSRDVDVEISDVPFFIEGCNEAICESITKIAQSLSDKTFIANSLQRKQLHIAAVFGCNFVNHMWAHADEILKDAGYSFDILVPLIKATLEKATKISPIDGQTGPARRGDKNIMCSHEQMLSPEQAELYRIISQSITKKYNINL